MSIETVITGGFGSFGTVSSVIMDGYVSGSGVTPPTPPTPEPAQGGTTGGIVRFRPRGEQSGRTLDREELERAVRALRDIRDRAHGFKRKNREKAETAVEAASAVIGLIETLDVAPPQVDAITAALLAASRAETAAGVMRQLALAAEQAILIQAWIDAIADDEDAAIVLLMMQ